MAEAKTKQVFMVKPDGTVGEFTIDTSKWLQSMYNLVSTDMIEEIKPRWPMTKGVTIYADEEGTFKSKDLNELASVVVGVRLVGNVVFEPKTVKHVEKVRAMIDEAAQMRRNIALRGAL